MLVGPPCHTGRGGARGSCSLGKGWQLRASSWQLCQGRDEKVLQCKPGARASAGGHPIPVLDPKTNKDSTEDAGIMLPHMVFSTLATGYPAIFESFGLEKLQAFWDGALATGDDRLKNVPALK